MVFGKTVPDVSLNAVANLGYAEGRFLAPVYPGDVLSMRNTVLESRPLASRPEVGLVKSRNEVLNQHGQVVLSMEGFGFFGRRHAGAPPFSGWT